VGLIGDNGAGKSTFAKIISGVFMPNRGTLYWNGDPVEIDSIEVARAMLFKAKLVILDEPTESRK